eukprot:1247811-Prymnesium_polylepis.1
MVRPAAAQSCSIRGLAVLLSALRPPELQRIPDTIRGSVRLLARRTSCAVTARSPRCLVVCLEMPHKFAHILAHIVASRLKAM